MSKLTFAVRFSDNTMSTFKIHKTIEFNNFKDIFFILNEDKLKDFIKEKGYADKRDTASLEEHRDYENEAAFLAPSIYGMVFIDFKDKVIYSYNDYSGFITSNALLIRLGMQQRMIQNGYAKSSWPEEPVLNFDDLPISFFDTAKAHKVDYDKGGATVINPFKEHSSENSHLYNYYQAYIHNIPVYYFKGKRKSDKEKVYVDTSSPQLFFKQISQLSDMTELEIDLPEWTIQEGSARAVSKIFKVLKEKVELSTAEKQAWKEKITTNY